MKNIHCLKKMVQSNTGWLPTRLAWEQPGENAHEVQTIKEQQAEVTDLINQLQQQKTEQIYEKDELITRIYERLIDPATRDFFTPDRLDQLALRNEEKIKIGVAKHPHTRAEALSLLASDKSPTVRMCVAGNLNTLPAVLGKLAGDKSEENIPVRMEIARNRNTFPGILSDLAGDASDFVRQNVAANDNTPPEALMKLAVDKNDSVRRSLAYNVAWNWRFRRSPLIEKILTQLADDPDEEVLQTIARGTNTPPAVLVKLAKVVGLQFYIAQNKHTPGETLTLLAGNNDIQVRIMVAENTNTPPEVLTTLVADKDGRVRSAALNNPNLDPIVKMEKMKKAAAPNS